MIATVQNTSRIVNVNGKKATVWEGFSQAGVRFHLFVIGDAPMTKSESRMADYRKEMSDVKPAPAAETAALPAEIAV
jgi:hypothetical protein